MGFYARFVLPRLVDVACSQKPFAEQRDRLLVHARGRVLELGIGTGKNLAHYDPEKVELVWGVDPSREMYRMARRRTAELPFPVTFFVRAADEPGLTLGDDAADTVVVTYSLCTIPDPVAALREARRALKPEGRLLFAEHGLSPDEGIRRWQRRLTPAWRRVGGGCHLDRDIPALIEAAGFRMEELDAGYLKGWKPGSYHFRGTAVPA